MMDYIWIIYGSYMDYIWIIKKLDMDQIWTKTTGIQKESPIKIQLVGINVAHFIGSIWFIPSCWKVKFTIYFFGLESDIKLFSFSFCENALNTL